MPGGETKRFRLAGGGDVGHVAALHSAVAQQVVADFFGELEGIALADALDTLAKAFDLVALDVEERRLDGTRADVDP